MDPTVLQRIITGFQQALEPGLATIRAFLLMWTGAFILLEALRVWGALLEDGHRWQHAVGFVVRTLVFASMYWGWPSIMTTLVEDFAHAGLRFAGSQMTVQQFLDPGLLLSVGLQTAVPLKDILWANLGLTTPVQAAAFLVAWMLYIVAYAIMSCNVFLLQVELTIVLPISLLALGFVFWAPVRNMAGGVLSYAVNVSLRVFAQAILASIIFRLAPLLFPPLPRTTAFALAIEQAAIMVIAAFVLAYLFWKIAAVIAQHLSGTPTLSAGSFLQTVAGMVGMATGATMLLRAGVAGAALRRPRAVPMPEGVHARRLQAAPQASRVRPPPMPATQALNATLRSGAQFLGHDHSAGGPHVSL
jgi:type IV secretion system protein TrbL